MDTVDTVYTPLTEGEDMELSGTGQRRSFWVTDEMWEQMNSVARKVAAQHDVSFNRSDFIRGACAYAIEHPEIFDFTEKDPTS